MIVELKDGAVMNPERLRLLAQILLEVKGEVVVDVNHHRVRLKIREVEHATKP